MRFADFWLLWKGYNDKLWYEHDIVRTQTAIIYGPLAATLKNPARFERLWPDRKRDKKPQIDKVEKNRQLLKKFREQEALRQYNEKNGSST